MKLNVAYPRNGTQKHFKFEEDSVFLPFMEQRIGREIAADTLGPEWAGYVLRITGGNDKQGFPMMQGVQVNHRVRLLVDDSYSCYRERKRGQRRRKSIRGCITGPDLSVLNAVIVKLGETPIAGLTDVNNSKSRGPKRASGLRKLLDLSKNADVLSARLSHVITNPAGKEKVKKVRVQRLITPTRLARKKRAVTAKALRYQRAKTEAADYNKVLTAYRKQRNDAFAEQKKVRKARQTARIAAKKSSN